MAKLIERGNTALAGGDYKAAHDAFADVPDEDHTGPPPADGKPQSEDDFKPPKGHQKPFVWFRVHLKLAPNHGPMALLLELPISQNTSMSRCRQAATA